MATKRRTRARAKPLEAAPEAPVIASTVVVPMVPIESLSVGDQFEHEGERYRRLQNVSAAKIMALHLTNPEKGWIGITQTAFDRSTLVTKK